MFSSLEYFAAVLVEEYSNFAFDAAIDLSLSTAAGIVYFFKSSNVT